MTTTDLETDRQHKAETMLRRSVVLTLRRHGANLTGAWSTFGNRRVQLT